MKNDKYFDETADKITEVVRQAVIDNVDNDLVLSSNSSELYNLIFTPYLLSLAHTCEILGDSDEDKVLKIMVNVKRFLNKGLTSLMQNVLNDKYKKSLN